MSNPEIFEALIPGFSIYLLAPLLILLALDALGRLTVFSLFEAGQLEYDNWLNRLLARRRLARSGLGQQLAYRGLKQNQYFQEQTLKQLDQQLKDCENCSASKRCQASREADIAPVALSDCPNGQSIQLLLQE